MPTQTRCFLALGAFSAALAIGLGAFGAHALKSALSPEMQAIYQTAVLYHLFHSLGLAAIAVACFLTQSKPLAVAAGWVMTGGALVFCGSLYLLALTGWRWLGAVTPVGGLGLIAAWLLLAGAALLRRRR